jgi:hypothetical protein
MRKGGAKAKGSLFEREVGRKLSLWLTNGEKPNIFARNVLSGGSFTITAKKGMETPNIPGDLMAASPLAFEFLSMFSVECKHRAEVALDVYLRDIKGTSFLSKTITHTKSQAEQHNLSWMVIAKQNHCETMVFMDSDVGMQCVARPSIRYHMLCNETIFLASLDHLISIPVKVFLGTMKARGFRGASRIEPAMPPRRISIHK